MDLRIIVSYFNRRHNYKRTHNCSLVRGVLGHGLGSLGNGVLGEFSWQEESDGGLDFSGGESVLLVVSDELGGLGSDLLEDVVDEGVHDGHGSLGDASLWVNLLEDSVDVDSERFDSLLLLDDHVLLGGFLSWSSWHFYFF